MADLHIRIPDTLAAKLKASARSDKRTVTAQVNHLLEKALK